MPALAEGEVDIPFTDYPKDYKVNGNPDAANRFLEQGLRGVKRIPSAAQDPFAHLGGLRLAAGNRVVVAPHDGAECADHPML